MRGLVPSPDSSLGGKLVIPSLHERVTTHPSPHPTPLGALGWAPRPVHLPPLKLKSGYAIGRGYRSTASARSSDPQQRRPDDQRYFAGTAVRSGYCRVTKRRRYRLETSATKVHQSTRYHGALFSKHRYTITASVYSTRAGSSNQCCSSYSSRSFL